MITEQEFSLAQLCIERFRHKLVCVTRPGDSRIWLTFGGTLPANKLSEQEVLELLTAFRGSNARKQLWLKRVGKKVHKLWPLATAEPWSLEYEEHSFGRRSNWSGHHTAYEFVDHIIRTPFTLADGQFGLLVLNIAMRRSLPLQNSTEVVFTDDVHKRECAFFADYDQALTTLFGIVAARPIAEAKL